METHLLINNGHGFNVCDVTEMNLPWNLTDETKFTEKKLCLHMEQYVEMVDRIFARIERRRSKIEVWGMFGRSLDEEEKIFIQNALNFANEVENEKRKRKTTLTFQFH